MDYDYEVVRTHHVTYGKAVCKRPEHRVVFPPAKPPPTLQGGGWHWYRGCDSYGGDYPNCGPTWPVKKQQLAEIRTIARTADRCYPGAAAFNTIGCIKEVVGTILPVPPNAWADELPHGLFVKDPAIPKGWLYFHGVDSPYNDSRRLTGRGGYKLPLATMVGAADDEDAAAFNTDGWLKERLVSQRSEMNYDFQSCQAIQGEYNGLFVRI